MNFITTAKFYSQDFFEVSLTRVINLGSVNHCGVSECDLSVHECDFKD